MKLKSFNPSTEEEIGSVNLIGIKDAENILFNLKKKNSVWRNLELFKRIEKIRKVKENLKKNREAYAKLITLEMGKPILQSIGEIDKCIEVCNYYIKNSKEFLRNAEVETRYKKSYIKFEPLGVVLSIMPWNYPFWQVFRSAIPVLLAGNSYVLKHSSLVPLCAQKIEEIFIDSGMKDFFRVLLVESKNVEEIISLVDAVTFTGGTSTGRKIAEICARNLKKCVLELGGSDPVLILDDFDMSSYAKICVESRMKGVGQSCTAGKRFIVLDKYKEKFEESFVNEMKKLIVGNPLEKEFNVGPLASKETLEKIDLQVKSSIKKGGKVLLGGKIINGKGFYFEPTIISEVKPGMSVFDEETFGPVAAIISAKNVEEAINLANNSCYGLGASILCKDLKLVEEVSNKLECGMVFSNKALSSDVRLPAGGIKESGYGRELSSFGMLEFMNVKSIVINKLDKKR